MSCERDDDNGNDPIYDTVCMQFLFIYFAQHFSSSSVRKCIVRLWAHSIHKTRSKRPYKSNQTKHTRALKSENELASISESLLGHCEYENAHFVVRAVVGVAVDELADDRTCMHMGAPECTRSHPSMTQNYVGNALSICVSSYMQVGLCLCLCLGPSVRLFACALNLILAYL